MIIDHDNVDYAFGALLMADFNSCKSDLRNEQIQEQNTPQNRHFRACHSGKTLEYADSVYRQRDATKREFDLTLISTNPIDFYPDSEKHVFYYDNYEISKLILEHTIAIDTKNKLTQLCEMLKQQNEELDQQIKEKK